MNAWTEDQLDCIGRAEEVQISSVLVDGKRSRWVTIWVVRFGDKLFVRSARGPTSGWFRATQERHEGRIRAKGIENDVTYVAGASGELNDAIDAAYRVKYGHYAKTIVDSMQTAAVRGTTLRLLPRSEFA